MRPFLLEAVHAVHRTVGGFDHGRFLAPHFPFAQVIQTNVRHDPIQPSMKTTIKPKCMNVPVNPQKGFLIDIPRVLRRSQQVHCKPQHTLIVSADKLLKSILIAALYGPNYGGFIHLRNSTGSYGARGVFDHNPRVYRDPLPPTEDRRGCYKFVTRSVVEPWRLAPPVEPAQPTETMALARDSATVRVISTLWFRAPAGRPERYRCGRASW